MQHLTYTIVQPDLAKFQMSAPSSPVGGVVQLLAPLMRDANRKAAIWRARLEMDKPSFQEKIANAMPVGAGGVLVIIRIQKYPTEIGGQYEYLSVEVAAAGATCEKTFQKARSIPHIRQPPKEGWQEEQILIWVNKHAAQSLPTF